MTQQPDLAGAVSALQDLVPHERMVIILGDIAAKLMGASNKKAQEVALELGSSPSRLRGVLELRRLASPHDTYIHEPAEAYIRAHSAIRAVCSMLGSDESVMSISLDGGASGRCTAVVINQRVIELQLTRWRRREDDPTQSPHFLADLFSLAEDPINLQRREMFVIDLTRPRQVLETIPHTMGEILAGTSVPAQTKLSDAFAKAALQPVPAYWANARSRVTLRDIGEVAPQLRRTLSRLPIEVLD